MGDLDGNLAFADPEQGMISNTTHDTSTSRCHIKLSAWLQQLNISMEAAWTAQLATYSKTAVLMLSWKDTDMKHASEELIRLRNVFEQMFNYHVEHWEIPSIEPDLETLDAVRRFTRQHGSPGALLIVYYAGHARPGSLRGSPPIWQARSTPEEGLEFNTAGIQTVLARAQATSPDVLLLSDCCNSLFAHPSNDKSSKAVVECLFAGGFEDQVPIAGPDSFTSALVEELAAAANSQQPLSVIELHSKIIRRLQSSYIRRVIFNSDGTLRRSTNGDVVFTKDTRITPAHLYLSVNKPPRSIHLVPTRSKDTGTRKQLINSKEVAAKSQHWPKVVLAIRLLEDDDVPDQLQQWLSSAPANLADLIGIHASFSTLLLMEVPLVVWDLLASCAAVSFVGFSNGSLQLPPVPQRSLGNIHSQMADLLKSQSNSGARKQVPVAGSRPRSDSESSSSSSEQASIGGRPDRRFTDQDLESQWHDCRTLQDATDLAEDLIGGLERKCLKYEKRLSEVDANIKARWWADSVYYQRLLAQIDSSYSEIKDAAARRHAERERNKEFLPAIVYHHYDISEYA